MTSICLDVSNYDADTFDAPAFKAAGVDRLIVGCQRPALARNMITLARAAGIVVQDVYAYIYFDADWLGQTEAAIAVAREFSIPTVWIDVEDSSGTNPASRTEQVRQCIEKVLAAGLRPGIYTGAWYWPGYMANTSEFATLPLWHSAYWDDHRAVTEVDYGGWRKVAIHQYTSSLYIAGRNRDANYIFEEDGMTPEEVRAIVRDVLADIASNPDTRLREVLNKRFRAVQSARTVKAIREAFDPDHIPGES